MQNDTLTNLNKIRRQFPIHLAYAQTINKSQEQLFQKFVIYLFTKPSIFTWTNICERNTIIISNNSTLPLLT